MLIQTPTLKYSVTRFYVSIVPELVERSDRAKADRVMKAMLKVKRIEIAVLERAYRG